MKGIPLKVAMPSSLIKKSSATLPYALLALFPGSAGSDLWPLKVMRVPGTEPSGGIRGSTWKMKKIEVRWM